MSALGHHGDLPNAAFGPCRLHCQASVTALYIRISPDEPIVFASGVHLLLRTNALDHPKGRLDQLNSSRISKWSKKGQKVFILTILIFMFVNYRFDIITSDYT